MVEEITPLEFQRRRAAGEELLLVDVREPDELAVAAVAGAVHIPMGEIPVRWQDLSGRGPVVIMCRSGGRSLQVALFLKARGLARVANLTGGIRRWRKEVDASLAEC